MHAPVLARESHLAEQPLLVVERFLRERDGVWQQISHEVHLNTLIRQMLTTSAVCLAGYGFVLGISHSLLQAISSAVKLPLLYLLTLAICLPTLYLANLLFGGRLSARQVVALLLSAITVTAVFTVAFAPISFFFLVTAQSYKFFLLLNVAILALTSSVGLHFLVDGVRSINALDDGEVAMPLDPNTTARTSRPIRPANVSLLQVWLLLYAFVGTQLGWTLRPFFGYPQHGFQLFRPIESNFYESIITVILNLGS